MAVDKYFESELKRQEVDGEKEKNKATRNEWEKDCQTEKKSLCNKKRLSFSSSLWTSSAISKPSS